MGIQDKPRFHKLWKRGSLDGVWTETGCMWIPILPLMRKKTSVAPMSSPLVTRQCRCPCPHAACSAQRSFRCSLHLLGTLARMQGSLTARLRDWGSAEGAGVPAGLLGITGGHGWVVLGRMSSVEEDLFEVTRENSVGPASRIRLPGWKLTKPRVFHLRVDDRSVLRETQVGVRRQMEHRGWGEGRGSNSPEFLRLRQQAGLQGREKHSG